MHTLPPYRELATSDYPVADRLAARGINLPSSAMLTREDVAYVAEALRAAIAAP